MHTNREITKVQELAYELTVEQAMTRDIVTVSPTDRVGELREVLRRNRISGAPVVDGGALIGIISLEDFIKCLALGKVDATVEQVMTTGIQTLFVDEPLIHAVNRFDSQGFGRFPVIERDSGKLAGILTKSDIITALLKELEIDYHEEEIHRYRASHIFEDIVSDMTTLTFEYDVVGQDVRHAGAASSGLKKTLARLGVDPTILRRVAIATYEAEMNIVIFTSGGRIVSHVTPEEIRIEARDSGPGIPDIEQAMQPGFSTAPPSVQEWGFGAGMGLPNIKKCADTMNIDSEVGQGTRLEAVIRTRGE